MKKTSVLAALICLLLAGAVFSQTNETALANFGGTWELDVAKSKLPDDVIIESGVLTVEQTKRKLTITLEFNRERRFRTPTPGEEDAVIGRGVPAGDGTVVFRLKENEIVPKPVASDGTSPPSPETLEAEINSSGNLKLTKIEKYDPQSGTLDFKTVETWELLDDGNTLKIARETKTPRGTQSSEMYFTKKVSFDASSKDSVEISQDDAATAPRIPATAPTPPKRISKGVVNGSAIKLPPPMYPAEARQSKASGAVNVQVEIDEQGNVVSATAVSGDSLLRAASEEAARNAKFAPTMLQRIPVKVTGIIVYNFVAP